MDTTTSTECTYNKKNLVITIGDPGGVGPEVTLKAINKKILGKANIIVVGSLKLLQEVANLINFNGSFNLIKTIDDVKPECINVIECNLKSESFSIKKTSKINGLASFNFIKKAIDLILTHDLHALVTAPISKEGFHLAGINFPGHTEILAHFTNTKKYRMMFINDKIKLILHTIHIPIKQVPEKIKKDLIKETVKIGYTFLKKACGIYNPKILIAGLNPHAGENGIIGDEEVKEIIPAINELKKEFINIKGPISPDTVFYMALKENYDLIVSMYHDQGLAPLKTLDFHGTINVTAGIPFIRTSPDHGTGFDIAWENKANPDSMKKAIEYALKLKKIS